MPGLERYRLIGIVRREQFHGYISGGACSLKSKRYRFLVRIHFIGLAGLIIGRSRSRPGEIGELDINVRIGPILLLNSKRHTNRSIGALGDGRGESRILERTEIRK